MIGFIIGFVLGSWFGVMVMAALALSKDWTKKHKEESDDG